jgi:hypothetical protein
MPEADREESYDPAELDEEYIPWDGDNAYPLDDDEDE